MSSQVLAALARHASEGPARTAIETFSGQISYGELQQQVRQLAAWLREHQCQRIALLMDNSPATVIADLAAIAAGCVCVPVPLFFSTAQQRHLLQQASIDTLLSDQPPANLSALCPADSAHPMHCASVPLHSFRLPVDAASALPRGCAKITYTSGSTGEPKGVCLSQQSMERVASSLCQAAAASAADRHLSLLPFATLLENIGGVYSSLLSGATLIMPPLAACGLQGSSSLHVSDLVQALHRARASSCIMIPQMLQALLAAIAAGAPKPVHLRYVAVGGAPVSPVLLRQAARYDMPVFEGYGLSEAASVVAVNTPAANRPGSVGKPLPHIQLRFADDGEIFLGGVHYLGYLGESPSDDERDWLATGDIGQLDQDGFLYLKGRKKHIFISAFGRNISPEWVERELTLEPAIAQACVFGEARPFVVAVVVPRNTDADIDQAIARANQRLPDYARIGRYIIADEAFTLANGQWTGTSRPRRQHIWAVYGERLSSLYDEQS